MGQRLDIEIKRKDKIIANSYFHWSAYTVPAIELTFKTLRELIRNKNNVDDIDMAIKALMATGAGVLEEDLKTIKNGKSYSLATNRNDGLIAITPESIENFENWQEGVCSIIIENNKKEFTVDDVNNGNIFVDISGMFYYLDSGMLKDEYELEEKDIPVLPVNIECISFNDFHFLLSKLPTIENNTYKGCFKDLTGQIFTTIY